MVVNGFYEWARQGSGKQPYYFHHAAHQLLAFAGLWEHWSGPMGEELTTCTIITCDANRLMAPIHHRMPVILAPEDIEAWLDPKLQKAEQVAHLLRPAPDDVLQVYKVGTHVNHSGNEGPRCIEPLDDAPPPSQQLNLSCSADQNRFSCCNVAAVRPRRRNPASARVGNKQPKADGSGHAKNQLTRVRRGPFAPTFAPMWERRATSAP